MTENFPETEKKLPDINFTDWKPYQREALKKALPKIEVSYEPPTADEEVRKEITSKWSGIGEEQRGWIIILSDLEPIDDFARRMIRLIIQK